MDTSFGYAQADSSRCDGTVSADIPALTSIATKRPIVDGLVHSWLSQSSAPRLPADEVVRWKRCPGSAIRTVETSRLGLLTPRREAGYIRVCLCPGAIPSGPHRITHDTLNARQA